jgi:hypothetical protein
MTDRLDDLLRQAGRSFTETAPVQGPRPEDAVKRGTRRLRAQRVAVCAVACLALVVGAATFDGANERADHKVTSGNTEDGTALDNETTTTTETPASTTTTTTTGEPVIAGSDGTVPAADGPPSEGQAGPAVPRRGPGQTTTTRPATSPGAPPPSSPTTAPTTPGPVDVRQVFGGPDPYVPPGVCDHRGYYTGIGSIAYANVYGGRADEAIVLYKCGSSMVDRAMIYTGEPALTFLAEVDVDQQDRAVLYDEHSNVAPHLTSTAVEDGQIIGYWLFGPYEIGPDVWEMATLRVRHWIDKTDINPDVTQSEILGRTTRPYDPRYPGA